MSLFNKVLASVGIGAAQVDTKLTHDRLIIGDEVTGVVEIKGGKVEQQIDSIYLQVLTTYIQESDDKKYVHKGIIEKYRITDSLTIGSNEKVEIPFSFKLPIDTPLTLGRTKVWIQTGLDIKNAIDPDDQDYIRVSPSLLGEAVLNCVRELGFVLRESECEIAPRWLNTRLPFIQELEFIPTSGPFRGKLDELELIFLPKSETSLDILIQIDRRVRGIRSLFSEALNLDETNVRLAVTSADIPNLQSKLFELIQRYS